MPVRLILPYLSLAAMGLSAFAFDLKPVVSIPRPCDSPSQLISPGGKQIALQCKDSTVHLVNLESGKITHTFEGPRVERYIFSRDGRWFAVGRSDGTVEAIASSQSSDPIRWKAIPRIHSIEFSPDSAALVLAPIDGPAEIWDLRDSPRKVATLQNDFGGLTACVFSPDGKLLVTADGDTIIRFYDTRTWQLTHEYRGLKLIAFAIAFAPDGKRMHIGGADNQIVELNLTGSELRRLPKDSGVVRQMSPVGNSGRSIILYTDSDGKAPPHVSFWNASTGESSPLKIDHAITGGGMVGDKLWLSTVSEKSLDVWEFQ